MKKTILAVLAVAALGGCTTSTKYGKCIGVLDKGDPKLDYSVSGFNLLVDFIFSETVLVPLVGVLADFQCPDGVRQ